MEDQRGWKPVNLVSLKITEDQIRIRVKQQIQPDKRESNPAPWRSPPGCGHLDTSWPRIRGLLVDIRGAFAPLISSLLSLWVFAYKRQGFVLKNWRRLVLNFLFIFRVLGVLLDCSEKLYLLFIFQFRPAKKEEWNWVCNSSLKWQSKEIKLACSTRLKSVCLHAWWFNILFLMIWKERA